MIRKVILLSSFVLLFDFGCYARPSKNSSATRSQELGVEVLNKLLANTSVLLFQTLHYHWNLTGPEFNDYHKLLDEQYNMLFADLDSIAERVRAIRGKALGSMSEMLKNASLKEDIGKVPAPRQMIQNLVSQYEKYIVMIKESIYLFESRTKDYGSKKMLEDLLEKYEKTAWMMRSLLGKQ